jgi:hypothetical protein
MGRPRPDRVEEILGEGDDGVLAGVVDGPKPEQAGERRRVHDVATAQEVGRRCGSRG